MFSASSFPAVYILLLHNAEKQCEHCVDVVILISLAQLMLQMNV